MYAGGVQCSLHVYISIEKLNAWKNIDEKLFSCMLVNNNAQGLPYNGKIIINWNYFPWWKFERL